MDIQLLKTSTVSASQPSFGMGGIAAIAGSRFGSRIRFEAPNEGGAETGQADETPSDETAGTKSEAKPASESEKPAGMDPEKAKLLKDVMKHKDSAKAAKQQADDATSKLNELAAKIQKVLGVESLDEIETALGQVAQDEEKRLKAAGEFDKLQARLVSEHNKEIKRLQDDLGGKSSTLAAENESLKAEIRGLLVSNQFASSQYIAEDLTLSGYHAEKLYGDNFKVEERDGKRAVVAYLNGEPLVDTQGVPLAFEAALKEIVDRDPGKDKLLKPKAKQGAGSGAAGKEASIPQKDNLRGASRIAASLSSK